MQNTLTELWGLLNWLYPFVFTPATERFFQRSYDYAKGNYDLDVLKLAQKLLAVIMLRRTKNTIQLGVPPREELTVFIPLTEAQRFWTYRMLTKMDDVDLNQVFSANNVKAEVRVPKTEALSKLGVDSAPNDPAAASAAHSAQATLRAPVAQRTGGSLLVDKPLHSLIPSCRRGLEKVNEPFASAASNMQPVSFFHYFGCMLLFLTPCS